jgi:hypothetical protein
MIGISYMGKIWVSVEFRIRLVDIDRRDDED